MPLSPPFMRFVAIDWSGARPPSAQRRAIVRCVVEGSARGLSVTSLEGGCDRQETVAWLADRSADGVRTLVGLDFPFAYPVPFLDHLKVPDFPALLARMASLDGGATAASCVDEFVNTCGKWWADRSGDSRRQVESLPATSGADSPLRALFIGGRYGFVGPRQVGKGAIMGIAAIAQLKLRAPSVRVWPFEDPADAQVVLAEIWPRLALGTVKKGERAARERHVQELRRRGVHVRPEFERQAVESDHAIDALAAAVDMASGRWPVLERSALPAQSVREGWILGVEPRRPAGDQPETRPSARQ
jgi:molybdopterin molybdotransferase